MQLKITPLKCADLVPLIAQALDSGPKSVIGIRLRIEVREKIWVSDVEIVEALHNMFQSGQVYCQDLGAISGLDEIDDRQRVGPSVLYSLRSHELYRVSEKRAQAWDDERRSVAQLVGHE